ncbi:hypothetical protein FIA58_020660 [Flavobacterium jejuense]|uniref:YhhN-like protein n=2 Tax=Flavobacterium jejuense TaxID=1544455 RepID=A0ABX0IWA4_9FLAO|nr:hypothetical protein [Flavobacterium jejuense]
MLILEILAYSGNIILLVNSILFFKVCFNENKACKIFSFYLLVMLIIQVSVIILRSQNIPNLYLSHFYFILQFLILSLFYFQIFNNSLQRRIIKISVPLCLGILGIQYYLNIDLFDKFNLFEIFITSFLVIIFSMFHFYNILNEKRVYYYINTGIFIYLFGSTFLFITGNLINTLTNDFRNIIWILNGVLYIVYQIYIFIEYKKTFLNKKADNE